MEKILSKGEGEKQETIKSMTHQDLNKDNYIHVPSINLYVAKQRSHLGLNWYDTHRKLHQKSLLMPTILQFLEFIKYLKANPNGIPLGDASKQEIESILDDILIARDHRREEWLDAKFKLKNKKLYINYNHRTDYKGNLIPQKSEPLEECLMEDCYVDL